MCMRFVLGRTKGVMLRAVRALWKIDWAKKYTKREEQEQIE